MHEYSFLVVYLFFVLKSQLRFEQCQCIINIFITVIVIIIIWLQLNCLAKRLSWYSSFEFNSWEPEDGLFQSES